MVNNKVTYKPPIVPPKNKQTQPTPKPPKKKKLTKKQEAEAVAAAAEAVELAANPNQILGKGSKTQVKYKWSRIPDYVAPPIDKSSFETQIGDDVKDIKDPFGFFDFIINEEMVAKIVEYTNGRLSGYKNRKGENKPQRLTDSIEIRAFLGILLGLGVTGKNRCHIPEIWKDKSLHHIPYFQSAMTSNRFQLLASRIGFDDVSKRGGKTAAQEKKPYYKIEEIFNHFVANIRRGIKNPSQFLTIDEQLYKFRGRCEKNLKIIIITRFN